MNRSSKLSQGCSKHLGQLIQEYCNDCKQLLCLQCIASMNHHDHQLSKYSDYLGKCTIEAEDYLRRVRNLAQRTEEARRTLMNYKKKYEECYRQSLVVLESFTIVSNGMKEWKEKTIDNLENRKELQLRQLAERISVLKKSREEGHPLQQKMVGRPIEIMLPEVLFFKQGIENLHKTIQVLSPSYISRQKLRERRSRAISFSSSSSLYMGLRRFRSRSSSCSTSLSTSLASLASDTSDCSVSSEFNSSVETFQNSLDPKQSLPIIQRMQAGELPVKGKPLKFPSLESFMEEDSPQDIYEAVYETNSRKPKQSLSKLQIGKGIQDRDLPVKSTLSSLKSFREDLSPSLELYEDPTMFTQSSLQKVDYLSTETESTEGDKNVEMTYESSCSEVYVTSDRKSHSKPLPKHYENEEQNTPTYISTHEASGSEEYYDDITPDTIPLSPKQDEKYDYISVNTGEDKKTPPPLPEQHQEYDYVPVNTGEDKKTSLPISKQDEDYDYIPFSTGEDEIPPPLPPQYSEEEQEIYDEIGENKKNPPPLPPRARRSAFQKKVHPFNIIAASCFAQTPNETVSLYDVCSTRDGNIVVSDPDNSCLRIATGTGENSKKITGRLKEMCQPKAVAYDSTHDRVLVSSHQNEEYSLGRVKIGRKITFKEMKLGKNVNPIAIASASCTSGGACCYVTVWPKSRDFSVHRLDCNGKFGGKLDVVKIPQGIDYHDSGYLVISDLKEGYLLKTTPEGKALWDKHADARTPGILNQPFGVVILPNQYVAVTESGNHRVSIFSDIGNLVVRFGRKGSDPGEFYNPQGICLHSSNQLIIVDSGNRRLQIFSLESLELFFSATDEQNISNTCNDDHIYDVYDI